MKNKLFRVLLVLITVMVFCINTNVNADMGEKPEIIVQINNLDTTNYVVDLFGKGYDYDCPHDSTFAGLTEEQTDKFFKLNFDGYVSISMRDSLLWGDCSGNEKHLHEFCYFGVPDTYRVVIMNKNTGEVKVSRVVHDNELKTKITVDYNTMSVVSNENIVEFVKITLLYALFTFIIEVIVAYLMNIKHMKNALTIFIANIITNVFFQIVLMYSQLPYIVTFVIMEVLIIIAEYLVYKKYFIDVSKRKIAFYAVIANTISLVLTLLISFENTAEYTYMLAGFSLLITFINFVISCIMKLNNKKKIFFTGFFANMIPMLPRVVFLNLYDFFKIDYETLRIINLRYNTIVGILVILTSLIEFKVYMKTLKDVSKKKIIIYTIISNIVLLLVFFLLTNM